LKILAFTYGHPEAHGALISSILSISENANNVDFYYKNNFKITYKFPDKLKLAPEITLHDILLNVPFIEFKLVLYNCPVVTDPLILADPFTSTS
jgi:hypothetical protein